MKACALAHLSGASLLALALAFGCGASKTEAPPPETAQAAQAAEAPSGEPIADTPVASGPDAPPAASAGKPGPAASAGADDDGPETRTMDVIANMIKARRQDARACYEKALKQIPGLKGDLVIHFLITPAGKVKTAEVNMQRSTLTNEVTAKCVMDVIKGISFPESSKGMESNVNYPFNFNP